MTPRPTLCAVSLSLAWAVGVAAPAAAGDALSVWHLGKGIVRAPVEAPTGPLPVGSLTKPFLARAWAEAHPGADTPLVDCTRDDRCWLPAGHGAVGLVEATAVSCNTYFRALAADTPRDLLRASFEKVGFHAPSPLTLDAAVGRASEAGAVSAPPEAVLHAYAALVREPWTTADAIRRALLAGMRDGAREGTARALAGRGLYAKTGTVPAIDGAAGATSGWVVTVDAAGHGRLALLHRGTGRQAAEALARAGPLAPSTASLSARGGPPGVRVSVLDALRPRAVRVRNVGVAPAVTSRGYVGPDAAVPLRPGDRLEDGLWELTLAHPPLKRRLRGALVVEAGPGDTLRLRAEVTPAEYVAGVLLAELPAADEPGRVALGAAALRFLAAGPRHGDVDVCDRTHCAWFVGRGPRVAWPTPSDPVVLPGPEWARGGDGLSSGTWDRIRAAARETGPRHWTSHCGGEPLSSAFLWGGGHDDARPCSRHGAGDAARWTRHWPLDDLAHALGDDVEDLRVTESRGRWSLVVTTATAETTLSWDEAHRRLARVLGWDALPSPADRVVADGDGFRAEGRGRGHRVGLCLASLAALD